MAVKHSTRTTHQGRMPSKNIPVSESITLDDDSTQGALTLPRAFPSCCSITVVDFALILWNAIYYPQNLAFFLLNWHRFEKLLIIIEFFSLLLPLSKSSCWILRISTHRYPLLSWSQSASLMIEHCLRVNCHILLNIVVIHITQSVLIFMTVQNNLTI